MRVLLTTVFTGIRIWPHICINEFTIFEGICLIICIIILGVVLSDLAIRQLYLKLTRLREEIILTEKELGALSRVLEAREQIEIDYQKAVSGL